MSNRIVGLKLCQDKCLLEVTNVNTPGESKTEAVKNFSRQKSKQDIRAWLGLTGYYKRFIPRYAQRTVNLTDALAGGKPDKIEWTHAMENEFQDLNNILIQRPVLAALDFYIPFIVAADASGRGNVGVSCCKFLVMKERKANCLLLKEAKFFPK